MGSIINCFEKIGFSSKNDFNNIYWKEIFSKLEFYQNEFSSKKNQIYSENYPWSRDPLHNWSRMWEYPYVYHHLKQFIANNPFATQPTVIDLGSGVTFFPFAVADLGYQVITVDKDPRNIKDMLQAYNALGNSSRKINSEVGSIDALSTPDRSVDVAYCISVLEHIPESAKVIREIARIIKPNGLMVLTIDVDLKGNGECSPSNFNKIIGELEVYFEPLFREKAIHPRDLNDSYCEPYPQFRKYKLLPKIFFHGKRLLRSTLKRKYTKYVEYWLACYCYIGRVK